MKQSLLSLLFIVALCKLNGQNEKKYILYGAVFMRDTGMLYLIYWNDGNKTIDSANIKNGKFTFTGFISEPVKASLTDDKKKTGLGYKNLFTDFFVAPDEMQVSLINNHFAEAKLTGSKADEEYKLLNKQLLPVYDTINALKNRMKEDSFKNTSRFDSVRFYSEKAKGILLVFVKNYPNSVIAAKAIGYLGGLDVDKNVIIGKLDSLPAAIKNGYFARWLKQYTQNQDNSAIGNKAPGFFKKDINGNEIKLSAFTGQYVLLDFWASWCIPCRGLTPNLKKWFKNYHSKGLNIISISSWEKDNAAWKKAIAADKTNEWYQILDTEINNSYHVQPIPDLILIDDKGIIIGRYIGDAEVRNKLGKKLSELFDK